MASGSGRTRPPARRREGGPDGLGRSARPRPAPADPQVRGALARSVPAALRHARPMGVRVPPPGAGRGAAVRGDGDAGRVRPLGILQRLLRAAAHVPSGGRRGGPPAWSQPARRGAPRRPSWTVRPPPAYPHPGGIPTPRACDALPPHASRGGTAEPAPRRRARPAPGGHHHLGQVASRSVDEQGGGSADARPYRWSLDPPRPSDLSQPDPAGGSDSPATQGGGNGGGPEPVRRADAG